MRLAIGIAAALALSLLPASATAKTITKATAAHDWARTVSLTSEGGFRMGNPAAPVKLVEYGSLACPHCRHFEQTGYKPLVQQYVRTGRVSYEFRNFLISGPDIAVSLLTRCAGPAKFFPMSEFVYAAQPEWQKKFETISDADQEQLNKMTDQQRVIRFAEIGRFASIAGRFGVTPAKARQCLADGKGLQRLLEMTKGAQDQGIRHTPTFIINGKVSDAATWEQVEPELKAALGGRS
jgi:protein-disulfide isomerase